MNLQTVITNLKNTISGKEKYLKELSTLATRMSWENSAGGSMQDVATRSTAEFLKINIDELKRILDDVEKCVEKDVEQSWRDNPDRMGGQFTQDEIDNANRW